MRRLLLAAVVVCAGAGTASAQGSMTASGNALMPGQGVGTGFSLPSVGTRQPQAAPKVGAPVGNAFQRPYDPSKPLDAFKGTSLDPKSVVAPVQAMGADNPNLLDRFYVKLGTVFGFKKPDLPAQPNYTPGIARRNRERAEQRMWRRD